MSPSHPSPIVPPPLPSHSSEAVRKNDILLINPFYPKDPVASFGKHVLTPTLALTSLAANTPGPWKVRHWDENLLQGPAPTEPVPEVVGITVHLTFARRAYALADRYRRMGAKVILGGLHVTAMPEEALQHADAIVVGEGVHTWPVVLSDIRNGTLRRRYDGSYRASYADDPIPDRSILPRNGFLTRASVIATRGCANRCGFCYLATRGLRMPYQRKPVRLVLEEIEALGERYVVFTDNNLTADGRYAHELCAGLAKLGIVWSAAITIDAARDESLVRAMAASGCQGVFVGLETVVGDNLREAGKRTMAPEDYGLHVDRLQGAGIQVNGSFVFGFDHDGPDIFERTVEWIEEHALSCATFHILTPYPGTPLFRKLDEEGRILTREWSLYDTGHAVFRPKNMTPAQLEEGYRRAYRRLFGHASIWRRRPDGWLDASAYLAMAYLYKRANPMWAYLIRHELTRTAWRPLVLATWAKSRLRRSLEAHNAKQHPSVRSQKKGIGWSQNAFTQVSNRLTHVPPMSSHTVSPGPESGPEPGRQQMTPTSPQSWVVGLAQ